jgi:hypothetical protein
MKYVKCSWFDPHHNKFIVRYFGPFSSLEMARAYLRLAVEVNGCDGEHSITSEVIPPYRPIEIEYPTSSTAVGSTRLFPY